MQNDTQKFAHSISEFARLSGVGRSFIYEQIKAGLLPVRKAGRRTLILRQDGEAWLTNLPGTSRQGYPK